MFLNLFDGHPEILNYPCDLALLYAYYPQYIENKYSSSDRRQRLKSVLFDELRNVIKSASLSPTLPDVEKMEAEFFNQIKDEELISIQKILETLIYVFTMQSGCRKETHRYLVFKETSSEIYAGELFSIFPEMKFIQLIRDPRDNYAALKAGVDQYYSQLGENEKETLMSLLHRVSIGMKLGLLNSEFFGKHRYLILKFEEIITQTSDTLDKITGFLNIKDHDCLYKPTSLGNETRGNNFDGISMTKISDSNMSRWPERISAEEAGIIEFHLGELMRLYGYSTELPEENTARAVTDFYKWSNYRYFYNDRFS